MAIQSGVFKVDTKLFSSHLKNKSDFYGVKPQKNKVAHITCTYLGDKSQKFAPAEKNSYTLITFDVGIYELLFSMAT